MRITFIFFLFSLKLLGQNDAANFEFNHDFKDEVCSFKDLTDDLFREEREKLKIKFIYVHTKGKSLDSLYSKDRKYFQYEIENYNRTHSVYSHIGIYNYDEYGFLINHSQFPISKYLTKVDSLRLNKYPYKHSSKNDTTTINYYFLDSLIAQTVHCKGKLLYTLSKELHGISVFDSIKKSYIYKPLPSSFSKTKYEYSPNGKLISIDTKDIPYTNYKWEYEYPKKNKILITNTYYNNFEDTTYVYQNLIIRDNANRIVKSILFEKIKPVHKTTYTMHYDKMGYLTSIDRRNKYKGWFDEKYTYYTFKNFYNKSKLLKTVAHYNFNVVQNDVIYNFDNNGLIKSIVHDNSESVFEYEFYKN